MRPRLNINTEDVKEAVAQSARDEERAISVLAGTFERPTPSQAAHLYRRRNGKNRFYGVTQCTFTRKGKTYICRTYRARIRVKNKYIHLGSFPVEEEAARCYDAAAKRIFGKYAVLNFPDE